MPHRTTYFFPRQFPDRRFDASSSSSTTTTSNKQQQLLVDNHEKKSATETFNIENDHHRKSSTSTTKLNFKKENSDLFTSGGGGSDEKFVTKKQQFAAFCDWLAERKATPQRSTHVKVKLSSSSTDEDRELLLPPAEPAPVPEITTNTNTIITTTNVIDVHQRNLEAQVSSLQRLSSGSSYAGSSLFSGTTIDGNFSSDVKDSLSTTREEEVVEEEVESTKDTLAQKARESYILQLTLARRLTFQANLVCDQPVPLQECGMEVYDPQTVSYRLWVSGCLSYSDKISDGFYNIMGMNPYLWVMCSDVEEGKKMPPLSSLKEIEPSETSMEVVMIDSKGDTRLKELKDKAQELYCASENMLVLVEKLGKLVAICMGGTFPVEQGDLHKRWKVVSRTLRNFRKCIVLPLGSLSIGLCRHRAILFKKLADYIGLPCRIARGCRYCAADHRSSCLVKIEDDRQSLREYVVDLVGEPGNVSRPDCTTNGGFLTSMPSPFRVSHLKEFQQLNTDTASSRCQILDSGTSSVSPEDPLYSGCNIEIQQLKETCLSECPKAPMYNAVDQAVLENEPSLVPQLEVNPGALDVSAGASVDEYPGLGEENVVIQHTYKQEIVVSGSSIRNKVVKQSVVNLASQLEKEDEAKLEKRGKFSSGTIPRYINLEPSLAMDWLEIAWDELHIKERVGAGSFGTVHRAEWHGSDVAVKVLTIQDFHDDQLKEFLREVAIMKRVRHPNVVLFMGAVTKRPHLSIVTEYLPRGSLFRLIHRPTAGEMLDHRRRLRMALDVAKGINYLHNLNPPILHWDLKSPNLLVDKNWTVKVCDFGLSRFKANTFISSKSVAGTPEWMAPEFLRGEPSNEKSDVYSFGVILWELLTMQQPWSGLSPAQVVGAVAFQNRRLSIPSNTTPQLSSLMESCWADEPAQRPSFANIVESLKKLLKSPVQMTQKSTG